jgi:hypothetical protein
MAKNRTLNRSLLQGLVLGVVIGLIVAGIPAVYLYQSSHSSNQLQSNLLTGNNTVNWNFVRFMANNANFNNPSVLQVIQTLPRINLIPGNTQIQRLTIWTLSPATFGFIEVQFWNSSTGSAILSIETLNTTSSTQTIFYQAQLSPFRSPNGTVYYPTVPSASFPTLPSSEIRVTLVAGMNTGNSITALGPNVPFTMNANIIYYQL